VPPFYSDNGMLTMFAVEFATVGKTKGGKVYHHLWGADEITILLKEHGLAKQEEADTG
jgi:20S proteasome subunit alpha 3